MGGVEAKMLDVGGTASDDVVRVRLTPEREQQILDVIWQAFVATLQQQPARYADDLERCLTRAQHMPMPFTPAAAPETQRLQQLRLPTRATPPTEVSC